ncbi:MAG: MGH1-like glycoside hydrolase domain-containing protein [Armatimonadota bacterium]
MKTIAELRHEMDRLMRERGIRTLAETQQGMRDAGDYVSAAVMTDTRPYFTGYDYGRLFDWDQYFEAILQLYAGWDTGYIRNALCIFLDSITLSGHIRRTLPPVWWGEDMVKPFLAQMAVLLARAGDDLEWFYPEYYYKLKHYLLHWLLKHDVRGEGLNVWDSAGHTGMDNQFERAGYMHDAYCEGVDLNAYLVRECDAFVLLAEEFRHPTEAEAFRTYARNRREALNRWCWDEAEGIYYDYHARQHRPIPVKHAGIFAALWAGVGDQAQADRLVNDHLLNPAEFWRAWPLPALAATEPGYVPGYLPEENLSCCSWRAHTWMPVNYYAMHGLRACGYDNAAATLAARSAELFRRHPFREYYLTDTGEPCGRDPFWGWSSLALYMEDECRLGTDPTRLTLEPL